MIKEANLPKWIKWVYSIRPLRYAVGGGIAAVVDLALLYLFTEHFGIYYIYSQILAFIGSFFIGFFFQKHITFQKRDGNIWKQGNLFLIFQLIGIGINLTVMWILVEHFAVHYMVAAVIAKGIVFVWNYIMNRQFNFI